MNPKGAMPAYPAGPWIVMPSDPLVIIPASHGGKPLGGSVNAIDDARMFAWPIARTPSLDGLPRWTKEQTAAAARLIAAAPAMMEALRYAEAFISIAVPSTARDREEAVNEVLPAIRDAIALSDQPTRQEDASGGA